MNNKEKLMYIKNIIIATIPDIIIVFLVSLTFKFDLKESVYVYFTIQAIYLLIWVKNSITSYVIFKYGGKHILKENFKRILIEHQFPTHEEYDENDCRFYLIYLLETEKREHVKIVASEILGGLNMLSATQEFQKYLKFCLAFEEALLEYKKLELKKINKSLTGK